MADPPVSPFLQWLILIGLIVFAFVVAWDLGLVSLALESDRSRISVVIVLVFVGASLHVAFRAWVLSQELDAADRLTTLVGPDSGGISEDSIWGFPLGDHAGHGLVAQHLERLVRSDGRDQVVLIEALRERARGSHDVGWLIADLMFKLGILGTVVGFILMLGSVADSESLDIASLQAVLLGMSEGMRVALYTTLTGLVTGILLGLQYLLVDRAADRLVGAVAEFGATARWSSRKRISEA